MHAALMIFRPSTLLVGFVRARTVTPSGGIITTAVYLPGDLILPPPQHAITTLHAARGDLEFEPCTLEQHRDRLALQIDRHARFLAIRDQQLEDRILAYLKFLAEHNAIPRTEDGWQFTGTHEELGGDVGAGREATSVAISDLRSAGRVRTGYARLTLLERKAAA